MRATVPVSKRASPPPTSWPRSMSTTPNSRSPARQRSVSVRYRGSNTWSGSTANGKRTLPKGNIGKPSDIDGSVRTGAIRRGIALGAIGVVAVELVGDGGEGGGSLLELSEGAEQSRGLAPLL